jgi:CubicO group peptidase (beta-lactamase class C family)
MHARKLFLALSLVCSARLSAQVGAALPRSTPEREGISSSAVLAFVQAADSAIDAMNSVMIVRHGRVVAEGWWAPYDARTPHVLYSLSKSFTSTAVGLAVAESKLSVDDLVLKFFPGDAPDTPSVHLREMRVRDLLRMNTGQIAEAPLGITDNPALAGETWVHRFLAHPVPYKPGTHFLYNSPATYMLSAIVQKTTGQKVLDYLEPRLFQPLGIERPTWVESPEGIDAGAYGLNVRTEDIAKLGLLYLQRGAWNGARILPATWVDDATARQTSNGSSPSSDWDQGYGYQFWRSRHGYRGDGAFGQYMLVLPEYDAVVVITSGVRDMQSVMNIVWDRLLPAMRPDSLAPNPVAERALRARLGALMVHPAPGRAMSPLAAKVSRRWYALAENDRGLRAIALDFTSPVPAIVVRVAPGIVATGGTQAPLSTFSEVRTPLGVGAWVRSTTGFANGMERLLAVPPRPAVALSGGWTADSVFTLKIVAPETPYYSTLTFKFHGDGLTIDAEHNVAFVPTKLPQLEGRAEMSNRALLPEQAQSLFNGKDLSGWHVDVPARDSNSRLRNPFIVRNGLVVSLGEPRGHLITDSSYRDYRLEVQYRFPGTPGNAGVLVHASTPRALYGMFPRSIEVQMESGNAGDFWCILEDIRVADMERRRGPPAQWGTTEGKARRILNLTDNSEKPVGEWNTMVIEAVGRTIKVWVNGDMVNDGFDATADHGQIALQSEGSEVEFRKLVLTRLPH